MTEKARTIAIVCVCLLLALFVPIGGLDTDGGPGHIYSASCRGMATRIVSGVLNTAETFCQSLKKHHVPADAIHTIVGCLSDLVDFRACKPGANYDVHLSEDGEVVQCSYRVNPVEVYTLKKEENTYLVYREDVELQRHIVKFSATIDSSLFESFSRSGESDHLILDFASIFASDIDFNTEPRPGDSFTIVFEKYYKGAQPVGYGRVLAARYETGSDVYEAYYYAPPGKEGAYYDANGRSLGKHFLRSPVPFSRLTSGFTRSRKHPILGVRRPHLGIDLAAPTGTPVLASADGVVVCCGRRGGYGKQVILKHPGMYETYYGHLSRFASGMRPGKKVIQGQVIGFVGATGLATGPHLDYRIKEKNTFRNPFSLRFKPKTVLAGEKLDLFLAKRDDRLAIMNIAAPRYEERRGIRKAANISHLKIRNREET